MLVSRTFVFCSKQTKRPVTSAWAPAVPDRGASETPTLSREAGLPPLQGGQACAHLLRPDGEVSGAGDAPFCSRSAPHPVGAARLSRGQETPPGAGALDLPGLHRARRPEHPAPRSPQPQSSCRAARRRDAGAVAAELRAEVAALGRVVRGLPGGRHPHPAPPADGGELRVDMAADACGPNLGGRLPLPGTRADVKAGRER